MSQKDKNLVYRVFVNKVFSWRRHPDLNWGIKVLQTSALPLGYGAIFKNRRLHHWYILRFFRGAGYEIRTRDFHLGKVTLYH